MSIGDFIQSYGQPLAQGLFIVILLLLFLYMLIARPKATCCSAMHIHDDDLEHEVNASKKGTKLDETEPERK